MTSALVVDSSVALGWSLEDETDATADATLAHVERHGALVPSLFRYEIANVLALLVRRKRIARERGNTIGLALDALDIVSVPPGGVAWCLEVTALASEHRLTVYDASYLHLALEAKARLATSDRALLAAADAYGMAFAVPAKPKRRRPSGH